MKKILSSLAVVGAVALAPATANAEIWDDWFANYYLGASGGYNIKESHGARGYLRGDGTRRLGTFNYHDGWSGGARIGMDIKAIQVDWVKLGLQLEGRYIRNDIKNWNSNGFNYVRGGHNQTASFMGYVIGTFDSWQFANALKPFVGAGIGYDHQWVKARGRNGASGDAFAYGAKGGFAFEIQPGIEPFVEYIYHANTGWSDGGFKSRADSNHSAMAGVNIYWHRPAPPPPPPQEVVVAAPKSYLVFFDWDKATITPEARGIIGAAANNYRAGNNTQIEVNGHTDTSGKASYNMGLSQRRADAVKAGLISDGVPATDIVVRAYGESQPLVSTGDGVREPQNRRVEIVIR